MFSSFFSSVDSTTGTLLLLCAYGLSKEVRPSEPYLTEYLTGYKGLDEDDVYQRVYPVWPYSYFALLVPVFLLTDLLRYKPVINVEGAAYVGTWALLLWADGVGAMQAMQFVYGIATSTEVAYYTYIYAKVSKDDYKKVSSFTRSAILTGRFLSGLLGQILDSTDAMSYRDLNYVSLGSVSFALLLSLFLPRVKTSIYFHRGVEDDDTEAIMEENERSRIVKKQKSKSTKKTKDDDTVEKAKEKKKKKRALVSVFKIILTEAKSSYSKRYVVKWSVWVAASTCLNFQVGNYIQPLWETIHPFEEGEIYNGAVEATTTLLGALFVFAVGFLPVRWDKFGDYAILAVSILGGVILIGMGRTEAIWFAYVGEYDGFFFP